MVIEGVTMVPKRYLYSTVGATTLLQFSPYSSLLMPSMWHLSWREKKSMDVTVVFLV